MSLRYSMAAAAALLGVAVFTAPASAVMQVVPMPDPNAPAQNASPPDGLFDKSFSDHWQKNSTDGQQGLGSFHFTTNVPNNGGANNGYSVSNPSAYDNAKQPGSEFYQPMQGTSFPYYNH